MPILADLSGKAAPRPGTRSPGAPSTCWALPHQLLGRRAQRAACGRGVELLFGLAQCLRPELDIHVEFLGANRFGAKRAARKPPFAPPRQSGFLPDHRL